MGKKLAYSFSGPLLFAYVWWVLYEAQRRSLKTLYFLARDGYLLQKIAQCFCEKFNLPIQCRYLYCSRASLRMPSYHLIGDEMYDLLLLGGYRVTIESLLRRANLDNEQQNKICEECGLNEWDKTAVLSNREVDLVRERIKRSALYREYVLAQSKAAFPSASGYLQQEGLLDLDRVAIVDSGWTGSMQRSLRQLLRAKGFQGELIGFYFGMYAESKEPVDGAYHTWYFDHSSHPSVKIPFCNNLFECLLSAPHGMTTGYTEENGRFAPITLEAPSGLECEHILHHIDDVLEYTASRLDEIEFNTFPMDELRKKAGRLIRRYMSRPSKAEAEIYGRFLFCDDTTESYRFRLADSAQIEALKGYSILSRVWRRFVSHQAKGKSELFWPFGTIALLPKWKQPWYRWNVYIWEWLRYVLR